MKKLQIRQRDRRALIMLALALVIYGLTDNLVLPAYDRLSAANELAAEKEQQLRRHLRAEQRKGQYENLLKLADERLLKSESTVIAATNLPLASAELQSLIEGATGKVGLMVGQRLIGTARRLNNFYAEIPMTLSFESTPGQLVAFLNELRALPRFVNVRNLQVSPVAQVFEAPKGMDLIKNVRVNVTVSALCSADLVKTGGPTR